MSLLFSPFQLGDIRLQTRVVMAPLTRNRASAGQVPNELMATYYGQRADPATGAALIVSEATQVSPMGQGYLGTPGIHSQAQIDGWKAVTGEVHSRGGRIVLQLWHVGRISHASLLPAGQPPVSSTTREARSKTFTAVGFEYCSPPRALATVELPGIVADFRQGALNAVEAGFDGVEVHGANGYLLDQFLRDSINDRSDEYGGAIEHRARLLLEVMQAVTGAVGGGRTGLRLSPVTPSNDAALDSDPQALMTHVVKALGPLNLAYLHLIEGQTGGARDFAPFDYAALRQHFKGAWMVNNGYFGESARTVVDSHHADLVAFGRPFIANPDLGRRLREAAELNPLDRDTLYGGDAKGYTDYAALASAR